MMFAIWALVACISLLAKTVIGQAGPCGDTGYACVGRSFFRRCSMQGGQFIPTGSTMACPPGNVCFQDGLTEQCVPPPDSCIRSGRFPIPGSCRRFYICVENGLGFSQWVASCARNHEFSRRLLTCTTRELAGCSLPEPELPSDSTVETTLLNFTPTSTPDFIISDTPDLTSPDTLDLTSPDAPDSTSPNTPDLTSPDTPDSTSPNTPDLTSPNTPDFTSPDSTSPDTPDLTSPDTPDLTSPDTPDLTSSGTSDLTSSGTSIVTSTTPDTTSAATSSVNPELTSPEVPTTPSPGVCMAAGNLLQDPGSCKHYYLCYLADGVLARIRSQCRPLGFFFDTSTRRCVNTTKCGSRPL